MLSSLFKFTHKIFIDLPSVMQICCLFSRGSKSKFNIANIFTTSFTSEII